MVNFKSLASAAAIVVGSAFGANAGTMDLIGLSGNLNQGSFGSSGSEYYAQSVTADDSNWATLRFGLSDLEGGSFNLHIVEGRAAGVPGTGFLPDADNSLFSTGLIHAGFGLQFIDLALNLAVTAGTTYFFVLDAVGETLSGATVRATEYNGTDQYSGGEFIFSNDDGTFGNGLNWSSRFDRGQDLAFRAVFDASSVAPIPLPAGLPLMAAALGLFGLVGMRRRKSRNLTTDLAKLA